MKYRLASVRLSLTLALLAAGCDDAVTAPPPLDATVAPVAVVPGADGSVSTTQDAAVATPQDASVVLDSAAPLPSIDAGASVVTTPAVAPLFVGSSRVFDPSGSNGYLFSFGSLQKETKIDLKSAIEIEDAWVFGDAKPYFYTATIFEPVLQRWTVSADGKFQAGPQLNLFNQGVEGAYSAASVPMFSADKSYFVDAPSLQVVVWNPKDMSFIKTIPIAAVANGDLAPSLDPNIVFRAGKMFVTVYWASQASKWTQYGAYSRVVTIDTTTDTIVASTDEPRTGSLTPAGVTSDGTVYYSPWDYHAAVRGVFGGSYGVPSHAVRIAPGADAPDAAYDLDLSALVGGRPAGNLFLLDDKQALIHVWHNDLVKATAANWSDTRFEPGYLWYRWQLGAATAEPLPDQQPSVEGGEWRHIEGKVVRYAPDSEYANTTLWELLPDGRQSELLTVPGWTTALLRAY